MIKKRKRKITKPLRQFLLTIITIINHNKYVSFLPIKSFCLFFINLWNFFSFIFFFFFFSSGFFSFFFFFFFLNKDKMNLKYVVSLFHFLFYFCLSGVSSCKHKLFLVPYCTSFFSQFISWLTNTKNLFFSLLLLLPYIVKKSLRTILLRCLRLSMS